MFLLQPGPIQSWQYGFEASADFCIWILLNDGLHSSPFDHHPEFCGPLQKIGLNEKNWSLWFRHVVMERPQSPLTVWSGEETILEELRRRWEDYLRQHEQANLPMLYLRGYISRLHEDLAPYYYYLPEVTLTFINYTRDSQICFLPHSGIISINDHPLDFETFRTLLLSCVHQLIVTSGHATNWKEMYQQYVIKVQQSLQREIASLPAHLQHQTTVYTQSNHFPFSAQEWLNVRLQVFNKLRRESEIKGIIRRKYILGGQIALAIEIGSLLLTVPEVDLQLEKSEVIAENQEITIQIDKTKRKAIQFLYALS